MKFEKELTEEHLKQIRVMAEQGLTQESIAAIIGISRATFILMMKHRPEIREAYDLGRARGKLKVSTKAFELATSGKSPWFTAFWLKCQAGWRETQHIQIEGVISEDRPIDDLTRQEKEARIQRLLSLREATQTIDVAHQTINEKDEVNDEGHKTKKKDRKTKRVPAKRIAGPA